MPLDEYMWIDRREILTFEEMARLANLFVQLGVNKIRLTGGEPLVRRNLANLVSKLSSLAGLIDLCLTTNGSIGFRCDVLTKGEGSSNILGLLPAIL